MRRYAFVFAVMLLLFSTAQSRQYRIISNTDEGVSADRDSYGPSISHDARYVAFISDSLNLESLNSHHADFSNIYVKDLETGRLKVVPVPINHTSQVLATSISGDGLLVVAKASAYDYDYLFSKHLGSGETLVSKQDADSVKVSGDGMDWYYNDRERGGFRATTTTLPMIENPLKQTHSHTVMPGGFDIAYNGSVAQVNSLKSNSMVITTGVITVNSEVVYKTSNNAMTNSELTDTISIDASGKYVLFAEKVLSKFGDFLGCSLKLLDISEMTTEQVMIPLGLSINAALCSGESSRSAVDISDSARYILINGVQSESLGLKNTSIVLDCLTGEYAFVFVDQRGQPIDNSIMDWRSQPMLSDDGETILFASNDTRLNPDLTNTQVLVTKNPLITETANP